MAKAMTDSGSKAMGSLYDLLLDYVDTTREHGSNFEIAQTLVEHYAELGGMSQREMAELCFVSQASFSRFCRFLGFDGFAEFKEAIDGANYRLADDFSRELMNRLDAGPSEALDLFRESILGTLMATLRAEDLAAIPQILEAIDGAKRVVFFSHHFLWQVGRYFQGKMMQLGKYVELYQSYEHQCEAAASLMKGDVAIICSMNGSYFSHYHDIVRDIFDSGARVVTLTQNRHALYYNRADWVLPCGDSNANDTGKYAALMVIDYLVMSYIRLLASKKGDA